MLKWMRLRYDRATLALRRGHALIRYQTNLLKYNIDTLITDIKYGRRRSSAQVPFMITQKMHKHLEGLGYTSAQIKQLDPSRAHSAIQEKIVPSVLFAQPQQPIKPQETEAAPPAATDVDKAVVSKFKEGGGSDTTAQLPVIVSCDNAREENTARVEGVSTNRNAGTAEKKTAQKADVAIVAGSGTESTRAF